MLLFRQLCGIVSAGLAFYCFVPYVRAILTGRTRPHQFSWIVFAIMNGIIALSQFLAGARLSAIVPAVFFVENLVTIALSFRYGLRDTSRYDRLLLILCLAIILMWAATRDNTVAIWLTVVIDIFATTMSILKIKARPDSEAPFPWVLAMLAYVFSCLTLSGKPLSVLYVRPVYGLLSDAAMVAAVVYFGKLSLAARKAARPA